MAKKKRENKYDEDYFELIIDFENELITHSLLKNLIGDQICDEEENAGLVKIIKEGNKLKNKRSISKHNKTRKLKY